MHPAEQARAAAEAAARQSYGKLVAFLAARTRDVAAAEDALADAFAAALSRWPQSGVPRHPEAWLMTVAWRRLIDAARRRKTSTAAAPELTRIAAELEAAAGEGRLPDERLGLMFACAHPAIEESVRAPLILQTILGFDAATIASAFLVSPAAMSQRLVRAKTRIRQAGIPLRIPEPADFGERLNAVLEAVYAAYAEGWLDPTGAETKRRNLAAEGIWLGRLIAGLMPAEPEALGLLALMLFAELRRPARRSCAGDYVPLAEQDTRLWDERWLPKPKPRCAGPAGRAAPAATRSRLRSSRLMLPGARRERPTGRRLQRSTMRWPCWRPPRWSPSTAPQPSGKRRAPRGDLKLWARWPTIREWLTISPTGRHGPGCLPGWVIGKRPTGPICERSALSGTPPCAASWKPAALISRFSPAPRTAPSTDSARRRTG